jgi:arsenate reductase
VLDFLRRKGVSTQGARSKSWEEFSAAGALQMDFVITVCDSAAGEACPIWPGHPVTAHWGVEDPALHMNNPGKAQKVIEQAFRILRGRILLLLSLPVAKLDRLALQAKTRAIARQQ